MEIDPASLIVQFKDILALFALVWLLYKTYNAIIPDLIAKNAREMKDVLMELNTELKDLNNNFKDNQEGLKELNDSFREVVKRIDR